MVRSWPGFIYIRILVLHVVRNGTAAARIHKCLGSGSPRRGKHVPCALNIDLPNQSPVPPDVSGGEWWDNTSCMDDHEWLDLLNHSQGVLEDSKVYSEVFDRQRAFRIGMCGLDVKRRDGAFRVLFQESIDDGRTYKARTASDQCALELERHILRKKNRMNARSNNNYGNKGIIGVSERQAPQERRSKSLTSSFITASEP